MWLPPSIPSSPPGSPAPPQVAAQSPPPTQPRERMAGTEFNRHHQQPPGKLGKVDTIIPVTVSGEQAGALPAPPQGRQLGVPTPHWARPLPGQCHGEEPIENSLAAWLPVKGRLEEAETTRVAGGTIEVASPPPTALPPAQPQLRALVYAPMNGSLLHRTGKSASITG